MPAPRARRGACRPGPSRLRPPRSATRPRPSLGAPSARSLRPAPRGSGLSTRPGSKAPRRRSRRTRAEVETLWRLLRYYLKQELPELQKNDIRLQAIGRLDALPEQVRRELDAAVDATSPNRGLLVNLAINYSGRAEIVDAVNSILDMARLDGSIQTLKIDEELIASCLYTASCPDPDLLIRTSGEMRISNFLLWQIAYAELYVTGTLWPDFTRTDLLQAVLEYQKRDRRYGGLSGAGVEVEAKAAEESLIALLRTS